MLQTYPQVLLISGSTRNVGKTTLSCRLIKRFADQQIIAVKVSPHWHPQPDDTKEVYRDDDLLIIRENNPSRNKDSARMLRCGARQVFYVQNRSEERLPEVLQMIFDMAGEQYPYIIESAALGKYIQPAAHFHITRPQQKGDKQRPNDVPTDHVLHFDGEAFDFDINRISCENGLWMVKEKA